MRREETPNAQHSFTFNHGTPLAPGNRILADLAIYFLVGVTLGTLAFLNYSILAVTPVHIAPELIFFIFVWPHDATRELIWDTGADGWFWFHVVQAVGFTVSSLLALKQLQRLRSKKNMLAQIV